MNVLDFFPAGYSGYCVEAGAYDGMGFSSTYELEQLGWKCLCIEPNINIYPALKSRRSLCLPYALSNKNESDVRFEIHNDGGKGQEASMSSFHPNDQMIKTFGWTNPEVILVETRTLDFCLKEVNFPKLDYLLLDVEGWEMVILEGFTLSYWKPEVLQIENIFQSEKLRLFIKEHEYDFIGRLEYDDFYVKKDRKWRN